MEDVAPPDLASALLALLGRNPRQAEFVSRLAGTLRRTGADPEAVERALADLERRSAILVREFYCADPHLDGADLRIAAVVPSVAGESDATALAVERIEALWRQWLGAYLASHTCT